MRVKIIPLCPEKELNKILEKMEDEDRAIDKIEIINKKIWIFHYKENTEEIKKLRLELNAIENKVEQWH